MLSDLIRRFLAQHGIAPCRIVVACSGGVDSTALLLATATLRTDGYEVVCAHINHHLRGDESDGDETFVRELCSGLGISLEVRDGTLTTEAIRQHGIEGAARDIRIALLQTIRHEDGVIATAHQKNDQAETIMMRMMTGTGVAGLRGIHPVRGDGIIRPLLDATRAEIEAFLHERNVAPRIDRTNADPRFLRNRVRMALANFADPEMENIASLAAAAQAAWPHLEEAIDRAEQQHLRITPEETRFRTWPDDLWMRQALLQRQIQRLANDSRDVSSTDLARLATTVDSIVRVSITRSLELIRRRGALVLRRRPADTPDFELPLQTGHPTRIPAIGASIEVRPARAATNHQLFQLPSRDDASFIVRNRRRGDRFQPLGMNVDKKLKDFLIDRKIAAEVRDRIPLLVWHGEIIWVGGIEISDRFKVTGPGGELFEVILQDESGQHQDSFQR